MALAFGTDGVRGPADRFTDIWVRALAGAAVGVLGPGPWVVGRDTRASGPSIAAAFANGVESAGGSVLDLGVAPTPAVAWVAQRDELPAVMVSASHNPWHDNGLKLFAAGGRKLDDATQAAIAVALDEHLAGAGTAALTAAEGRRHRDEGSGVGGAGVPLVWSTAALEGWVDHLVATLDGRTLSGLHVVLDCANGAASVRAPETFTRLGAEVAVIGDAPDGRNINHECGSTHPDRLADEVVRLGADVGFAFDGDADRLVAVASDGSVVDGDHLLALLALDRHQRGLLAGPTVVITVMANLGLRRALADAGIGVVETPVGDRHILVALDDGALNLGGEQSGHIIFGDLATTGDGTLCAVQIADLIVRSGRPLGDLAAAAMTSVPQLLVNVALDEGRSTVVEAIAGDLARATEELGDKGRVLVRPSGTEPLVRIMVEATDAGLAASVAERLAEAVRSVGPSA